MDNVAIGIRNGRNSIPFLKPLTLSDEIIYQLAHRFSKIFKELAATSLDQFFPIPVTRLPTGMETGHYLAAYVGLSYLRVAFIDLLGESAPATSWGRQRVRRTLEKAWPIEESVKKGNPKNFFAWIGDCIAEVVADSLDPLGNTSSPATVDMGISFCFPMKQNNLHEAILMPTGKGFALNSDLDLRQALLEGYERHTRHPNNDFEPTVTKRRRRRALPALRIAAITNDTVATLASLAYSVKSLPNSRVVMGLIVGAGCNATVPMQLNDLHESKTRPVLMNTPEAVEALVNTEWTLSAASPPLRELDIITKWDRALESSSDRPGFQPLEYMVGGRYIGELVRIITYDYLHNLLHIPQEALPLNLTNPYRLTTDFLSLVVAAPSTVETLTNELSEKLPPPSSSNWQWSPASAGILRAIASTVQSRSAALIAAAIVGLLNCTDQIHLTSPENLSSTNKTFTNITGSPKIEHLRSPEELVVAFSGGVIQHYPKYKEMVQRYIDRILLRSGPQDGGKSIFLREASDGGIIGVGVLAGTTAGKEIERIIGSTLPGRQLSI